MNELDPTAEEIAPLTEATLPDYPTSESTVAESRSFDRTGELPAGYKFTRGVRIKLQRSRILFRRSLTAQLHLMNRWTQTQIKDYIAENYPELKCSQVTVSQDLAACREQWAASARMSTADTCDNEIAKLDALEASLTEVYEDGNVAEYATEMLKVAKRRAALLGLDKAQKVQVSLKPLDDMTDEELIHIVKTGTLLEVANAPAE